MSLNRTLVAGVSSVVLALGTLAPKVFASKTPECLQSLANQASDIVIKLNCGIDFGNGDLFFMFVVGGGIFLVITFWKDILQFLGEKLSNQDTN